MNNPPTGKKKVIRRLVKNAKTGEIIKTEIVRIDSNGESTVTAYPAGTPVPSFGTSLASGLKKMPTPNSESPSENVTSRRSDIGPSVPVNISSIDDLLAHEKDLIESAPKVKSAKLKETGKDGDECLESTLITIMKSKRQREPKPRKRGLVASTFSKMSPTDENADNDAGFGGDTDYRDMGTNVDPIEEEENHKRREKHRRRHEKKGSQKKSIPKVDHDLPDSNFDDQELHPLEEAELLARSLYISSNKGKHTIKNDQLEEEGTIAMDTEDKATYLKDNNQEDIESDKQRKKKKKHKQKKKKKKLKQSKVESDVPSLEKESSQKLSPVQNDVEDELAWKQRSRSNSLSTMSLSSISSAFSDSFDFAEGDFKPPPGENFDNALGEYQRMRGIFPIRGRGTYDPFFRGGRGFRGYPNTRGRGRQRGNFRGRGWGMGGDMTGYVDPATGMVTGMMRGRGVWRGNAWFPGPPGWGRGFNNGEEGGIGIYVEDDSDDGKKSRRSDSSRSYSSSYSSRSRSRRRRRHRHRSSSDSYSSYSRSYSRSYTRSYSTRSYSRSYSRSRSYSDSRSRSRSWSSSSHSRSRKASLSPSRGDKFSDIYSLGANQNSTTKEEEVPWWAEFDKTYENQKRAMAKNEEVSVNIKNKEDRSEGSLDTVVDIVRCVLHMVDTTTQNLESPESSAKYCVDDLITRVCVNESKTSLENHEIQECLNTLLDNVSLKYEVESFASQNIYKTVPMQSTEKTRELSEWYGKATLMSQKMSIDANQAKTMQNLTAKDQSVKYHYHRTGRKKKRYSRSRSSSASSSNTDRKKPLVNLTSEQQQSLQQAQQMLIMQQKQLQAAGILPASFIIPESVLGGTTVDAASTKWDKDMEALMKHKTKDDLTRKVLQRMKGKKNINDEELSPTFFGRNQAVDATGPEKIFSGSGNLKSRKIAISIDGSKILPKSEDHSPSHTDENDGTSVHTKGDIVALQSWTDSKQQQRGKAQEHRGKLEVWSDEQKVLKEEVKRKMREEIERAERAKKEKMKEELLEQERQHEIMRIREEVREQIKKEIQEEIAKQRKEVLTDPELKSQIMELETLKKTKAESHANSEKEFTLFKSKDDFLLQQDKHKQEMNMWLQQHGKKASEMNVDEMRKMQVIYMQQLHHWSQQQQQSYMQWYWHQQNHYKQHQTIHQKSDLFNQPAHRMPVTTSQHNTIHQPSSTHRIYQPSHSQQMHYRMPASSSTMDHSHYPISDSVYSNVRQPVASSVRHPGANVRHPPAPNLGSTATQSIVHPGSQNVGRPMVQNMNNPTRHSSVHNIDRHVGDKNVEPHLQTAFSQPRFVHNPFGNISQGRPIQSRSNPTVQFPPPAAIGSSHEDRAPGTTPPPGTEQSATDVTNLTQIVPVPTEANNAENRNTAPATTSNSVPKKKKKKHRKHKKKKEHSSSSEDDEEEAEREKIMEQLAALQAKSADVAANEVEDGEVQSDNETKLSTFESLTTALLNINMKKKKKHKRDKKKKRAHKDSPSKSVVDDKSFQNQNVRSPQPLVKSDQLTEPNLNIIRPPPFFHDLNSQSHQMSMALPDKEEFKSLHEYPKDGPHSFSQAPRPISVENQLGFQQNVFDTRRNPVQPNFPHQLASIHVDKYGSGEPGRLVETIPFVSGPPRHDLFKEFVGPSGDNNTSTYTNRQPQSPLPIIMPNDSNEMETWARQMGNRYQGSGKITEPSSLHPHKTNIPLETPQNFGGEIQGRKSLGKDQFPPKMLRKRERPFGKGRGRKRKRNQLQNYHDWDQPPDDGLVYYYSESGDSSGWGSDKDFDNLLAKKQWETGTRGAEQFQSQPILTVHPSIPKTSQTMPSGMGEPQGIPVIGGIQPQPIPSLANRNLASHDGFHMSHDQINQAPRRETDIHHHHSVASDHYGFQQGIPIPHGNQPPSSRHKFDQSPYLPPQQQMSQDLYRNRPTFVRERNPDERYLRRPY